MTPGIIFETFGILVEPEGFEPDAHVLGVAGIGDAGKVEWRQLLLQLLQLLLLLLLLVRLYQRPELDRNVVIRIRIKIITITEITGDDAMLKMLLLLLLLLLLIIVGRSSGR